VQVAKLLGFRWALLPNDATEAESETAAEPS
jgi:hypothetical protein